MQEGADHLFFSAERPIGIVEKIVDWCQYPAAQLSNSGAVCHRSGVQIDYDPGDAGLEIIGGLISEIRDPSGQRCSVADDVPTKEKVVAVQVDTASVEQK